VRRATEDNLGAMGTGRPGRKPSARSVARDGPNINGRNTYEIFSRHSLPRGHFFDDRVGHRADQIRRDLDGVHLMGKRFNLADRRTAGIQCEDLVGYLSIQWVGASSTSKSDLE